MEYLNLNTFILGTLFFACLYTSNVVFSLICLIYKIKIVEFSIFFNPWFSLYKEKVFGTQFTLGWLPLGGFIKPLGISADDDEKKKFKEEELPFVFFTKPKYLRFLFNLVPMLVYLIFFCVSFVLFFGYSDIINEWKHFIEFISISINSMFNGSSGNEQIIYYVKKSVLNKNVILFVFTLLISYMFVMAILTNFSNWLSDDNKVKSIIHKILGYVFIIGIAWVMFWKIPSFIFSFFTFSQNMVYVSSFFIGMFSAGLVSFYSTLFIMKNVSQNLTATRFK